MDDSGMDDIEPASDDDLQWMELLAGRAGGDVGAERPRQRRQALQLRQYFTQVDAGFADAAIDPQHEARMLRRLTAAGVLAPAARPARASTSPGRLGALLDWLLPPFQPMGGRALAVSIACFVATLMLSPMAPAPAHLSATEDRPVTKGFGGVPVAATTLIVADDPAALAAEVAARLRAVQVESRVTGRGGTLALHAIAAPGRHQAVREALARWGIRADSNGRVDVRFESR